MLYFCLAQACHANFPLLECTLGLSREHNTLLPWFGGLSVSVGVGVDVGVGGVDL